MSNTTQGSILEAMQSIGKTDKNEFIYELMRIYGFPNATITRLKNNDTSRNIGRGGDVGVKKRLYFTIVENGENPLDVATSLQDDPYIERHECRFVIATDFTTLAAVDRTARERLECDWEDLGAHYGFFLPLAGYEKAVMFSEHPADLKASEKMGQLFDLIKERNHTESADDIHALNVFLTRLLFCFYAEDTGIFAPDAFTKVINDYTECDGSNVSRFLTELFIVLNTPENHLNRKQLPAHLAPFPFVNGKLFKESLPIPDFGAKARRLLIECGQLDWSAINPDIFGSMFQAVIDSEQRGNLGQHYTSVSNIMKVISPLFLDDLYAELEGSRNNEKKLNALLVRLTEIQVFDPACGSGNFLIIAYKELRQFEIEVIDALNALNPQSAFIPSSISLSQFYGIEIDDFAREIAILALWIAEHQMNDVFRERFGNAAPTLPLKDGGQIVCGNSLQLNWESVCPPVTPNGKEVETYIIGNPPFLGSNYRSKEQDADMTFVFDGFKTYKSLDFVSAWFWKASQYIKDRKAQFALVSTNSICQGTQVAMLWPHIFNNDQSIRFAYPSFPWKNQAKSNAAVHVVIVGVANKDNINKKALFHLDDKDNPIRKEVKNISPYLLEGSDVFVAARRKSFFNVNLMTKGNQPADGGNLILTDNERAALIKNEPNADKWIRPLLGSKEFIDGYRRWCLWLVDASKKDIEELPLVNKRVQAAKAFRLKSSKAATRDAAKTPHLFDEIRQPLSGNYVLIPCITSERRSYIPIGFVRSETISTNRNFIIPDGTMYEVGILTSEMHNDWMRAVGGRLESRYSYSNTIVYNTFPWPDATKAQREHITKLAEEVLLCREDYPMMTLAELYDPDTMPATLLAAHKELDAAVEALYRKKPFRDAAERLEHLFGRYEKLVEAENAKK